MYYQKVFDFIRKYKLIDHHDTVILALSGGKDSVVLLDVLHEFQKEESFFLILCHYNHGIRGKAADEDEQFCKELSRKYGYPFFSEKGNMEQYAKENALSKEEAGRKLRYEFFRRVANQYSCSKIATAHHKNDHAETVLLNFFRGCGLDGLEGISKKSGEVIRPLLCLNRFEIEQIVKENQLFFVEDFTNKEMSYQRNRIRLDLLPYIEKNYVPDIIEIIDRFSDIIREENQYIENSAKSAFSKSIHGNQLNIDIFFSYPIALQRRMIRNWISILYGSTKDFTFYDCEEILKLKDKATSKKYEWKNLTFHRSYSEIIALHEKHMAITSQKFALGLIKFGHYEIRSKIISSNDEEIIPKKGRYYFDAKILEEPLVLRTRQNGDRMMVFGGFHKKIKDIYIDEKMDAASRDSIPILVGNEIYLVGDMKRSDYYLVTNETKKILLIEVMYE